MIKHAVYSYNLGPFFQVLLLKYMCIFYLPHTCFNFRNVTHLITSGKKHQFLNFPLWWHLTCSSCVYTQTTPTAHCLRMSFATITFFSTVSFQILYPTENARGFHIPETTFSILGQDTSHREALLAFFNPSAQVTRQSQICHGRFLFHSSKCSIHYITNTYDSWLKHRR
jgi:hypothetical protein